MISEEGEDRRERRGIFRQIQRLPLLPGLHRSEHQSQAAKSFGNNACDLHKPVTIILLSTGNNSFNIGYSKRTLSSVGTGKRNQIPLEPALWICADPSGPIVSVQFAFDDLVALKTVTMWPSCSRYSVIVNRTVKKTLLPHLPQTACRRDLPSPPRFATDPPKGNTSVYQ